MKTITISELCENIYSGGTPLSGNKEYYDGDIPFLSITDIKNKYVSSTQKHITQAAIENSSSKVIKTDTVCMTIYATIGVPFILKNNIAIPQSILAFELKKDIDSEFFYYYLLSLNKKFERISTVGTQPNLSKKDITKVQLHIPDNIEQIKIGSFFKELDELIELYRLYMEIIRKTKESFILNFIKSVTNTVKIQDICDNFSGKGFEKHISSFGKYKVIMLGNISAEGDILDIQKYVENPGNNHQLICEKGDLVMALTDKNREGNFIGKTAIIQNDDNFVVNQRLERIVPKDKNYSMYLQEMFNSKFLHKKLVSLASGAVQLNLSFNNVKSINIPYPTTPQIKSFNDSLNTLNTISVSLCDYINNLTYMKKYYLNKIFN